MGPSHVRARVAEFRPRVAEFRAEGDDSAVFDGFIMDEIDTGEVTLRVRHGGDGPPLLLLHGHPRTHATWHRVAPLLAATHTVVCPDLRGYGGSGKPASTPDHRAHSKRTMAADCVALLRALGHDRFAVAGHDRGGYVATRLALDHPDAVSHLAVLDGVPIGEALNRCDARFAAAWWHWFFLSRPAPLPERVILADPEVWYGIRDTGAGYASPGNSGANSARRMGTEAFADFHRAITDPDTVHAMCEDYRAGVTVDWADDEADRAAGTRIRCPLLVLWATQDDMEMLYGDIVPIWRNWTAGEVSGVPIHSGHHMAEEAPETVASELLRLLTP